MDRRNIIKGLTNYLMSLALALVVALYLSGRIGWFLIAAFICAPIVSLALTAAFVSRIYASIDGGGMTVSKGDSAELAITLSNGFILPSPPVCIKLFTGDGAAADEPNITCTVMPMSEEIIPVKYLARISGPHKVGVESIVIRDYFGLISFKLRNIDTEELHTRLDIIPDIADVPFTASLFRRAEEISAMADDSEDTVSDTVHMFGGFPGYDSREYVPGDPLKRINWKQSAKKGSLLVRLDDETPAQSINIVLDGVFEENIDPVLFHTSDKLLGNSLDELRELAGQWAVEQSLGMVRAFVRRNYSVTYYYMGEHGWQSLGVADENELTQVQTDLASMRFSPEMRFTRYPADEISNSKGGVSVFFTPFCNAALYEELTADSDGTQRPLIAAAVTDGSADGFETGGAA